ncbi:DDE-type integrase/transposase/recombinase (plasmid) [Mycobacterium intracellulare subsp. chimaera]|nr:DDE-type integrase/transposase/recombinase [Mycobacterium intracellulare subsp. chimaera]QGK48839.1 DDE-type integrase/transposase/recombinase [Mycobacterium intracellulare subsp. chimaera]QGK49253.1 DDE-type integrase/transposase/recombinase [Mycobacterium intracellulare subsp. chimaera]QGK49294.1 DDE-type integrase/transposase/recombinase [Mycobacterium intracellulare subsp. chimaera]QGK50014.1 DDE-type integrase/transposase/recombinase [Mycobacterium intracellulare subsp. chimaera]
MRAAAGDGDRAGGGPAPARGKTRLGLTTGPVPARVHADVKAGLLDLIDHAVEAGWPARRACLSLGVDDLRAARWAERRAADRLEDLPPGGHPLHGLLPCERAAIVALHAEWGEVDRSHRKLAHRGSYLHRVWVSESTVRKVLAEEGLALQGNPLREPIPRTPWPDWLEWKPNRVWGYDFTHFTRAKRAAIAILDIVSRKWIATVVSAEETSSQVEVAFIEALQTEGLWEAADARATAALVAALDSGDRDTVEAAIGDGQRPLLLAISDNGPQMRSHSTREFLAGVAIAQQFGRPHTPQDQAWIETLFGHVKGEWPHLEHIRDPGELDAELDRVRSEYNTIRLHAGIGYVTPHDEHEGRGDAIRQNRRDGLAQARENRIAYRRDTTTGANR